MCWSILKHWDSFLAVLAQDSLTAVNLVTLSWWTLFLAPPAYKVLPSIYLNHPLPWSKAAKRSRSMFDAWDSSHKLRLGRGRFTQALHGHFLWILFTIYKWYWTKCVTIWLCPSSLRRWSLFLLVGFTDPYNHTYSESLWWKLFTNLKRTQMTKTKTTKTISQFYRAECITVSWFLFFPVSPLSRKPLPSSCNKMRPE